MSTEPRTRQHRHNQLRHPAKLNYKRLLSSPKRHGTWVCPKCGRSWDEFGVPLSYGDLEHCDGWPVFNEN